MPLNREWFEDAQTDLAEDPVDTQAIAEVEEELRRLYDEETVVWKSPAWERIDALLATEFARESQVIFSTNDTNELMFARERGRVIARLRKRPAEVAARLQELARRRRILTGDEETPEE